MENREKLTLFLRSFHSVVVAVAVVWVQGLYTEESRWSGHAEDAALVAAAREKADRNEVSRWAPLTREALARESRTKTRHSRRPFTTLRAIRCAAGATGTPDKYVLPFRNGNFNPLSLPLSLSLSLSLSFLLFSL